MKKLFISLLSVALLIWSSLEVQSQNTEEVKPPGLMPEQSILNQQVNRSALAGRPAPTSALMEGSPEMLRFSLDWPGGTPGQLIKAIEKARGEPVNAIIPPEFADTQLPPFKMHQVTVSTLFAALEKASERLSASFPGAVYMPPSPSQSGAASYGFKAQYPTFPRQAGEPREQDIIWSFYRLGKQSSREPTSPPESAKSSIYRYYQLNPYLDKYTVEDITSAIKKGWELLQVKDQPAVSFHPSTQLLIAVGAPEHVRLIEDVLAELSKGISPAYGAPGIPQRFLRPAMPQPVQPANPVIPSAPPASVTPRTD